MTYDQARQYGKTYVGALNTGVDAFAGLFANDAFITVGGVEADIAAVLEQTPPTRCNYRGARLEDPYAVLNVRVRIGEDVTDIEHRVALNAAGLIATLVA